MNNLAHKLMAQQRACATAPAGCGKTQTIAQMVALNDSGVQLILTHTHAGVQSLAKRLKRLKIPSNSYCLETISGWALNLALSYPQTSGFSKSFPDAKGDWKTISRGVTQLLSLSVMKRVIRASYKGVIVDEYQDCTQSQHRLILAIANIIPCRLLGDPLQGIFGFGKDDKLIDWQTDVKTSFAEVEEVFTPYRWKGRNEQLGHWLMDIRRRLLNNEKISLVTPNCPVEWMEASENANRQALWASVKKQGTVIAIHPENSNPHQCHKLASQLKGQFQSIEEMDAHSLLKWAEKLDTSHGRKRAVILIDFASDCCTAVSTELRTIKQKFEKDDTPNFTKIRNYQPIALALLAVANKQSFKDIAAALERIQQIEGSSLYRADLWYGMLQALQLYNAGNYQSLKEAAWQARQRQKNIGRFEYQRVISRTLLVKGLEYDHGILLDADMFDKKNLYVALTRASTSLTIVSTTPFLNPS